MDKQASRTFHTRCGSDELSLRGDDELWTMAAIAFLAFYSNSMIAPLIPALARGFGVLAFDLKWLIPGFSMLYGTATLLYGQSPIAYQSRGDGTIPCVCSAREWKSSTVHGYFRWRSPRIAPLFCHRRRKTDMQVSSRRAAT